MNFRDKAVITGSRPVAVTRWGMGTAAVGLLYEPVDDETAVSAIRAAYDAGIRYFDTAPLYGEGEAERRLGLALATLPREELTISTKVGYALKPEGGVGHDYRPDAVERSLAESLRRLGLDRVDIVFIHDPDDHYAEAMAGAYPVLARLREEGVVGAIGAGMNQSSMLTRFFHDGDFDCFLVAGRYTLLDQTAAADLLPAIDGTRIRLIIGGPYNSGILADPWADRPMFNYAPADAAWLARARAIDAVAGEFGVSLKAAALQFPLAHPAVATVLTGMRSRGEVEENARLLAEPIPVNFWQALVERGLLSPDLPYPDAS